MSKYVIVHGQMYEIPDDELMHWKYIKREKKNGKWVYTYEEPKSIKSIKDKIGITAKNNAAKAKAQYEQASKQLSNNSVKFMFLGRWKPEHAAASKEFAKALENDKSRLDAAKKVQARNEELVNRAMRDVKITKHATGQIIQGKRTSAISAAKTMDELNKSDDAVKKAQRFYDYDKNGPGKYYTNTAEKIDRELKYTSKYIDIDIKNRNEAGRRYAQAQKAYMESPLGKIETASKKVKARIDSAKDYIHELITNERGTEALKEYNQAKHDLRNALAMYDSRNNRYEKVKSATRSGEYFDKDNGNASWLGKWKEDVDAAQKDIDDALKRVTQAREAYEDTPMGKREKRADKRKKR